MVKVKLYVEGAGQTDLERSQCRRAFSTFFEDAGLTGKRPRTVPCGGRDQAYDAFRTALKAKGRDELPLLLVDSEDPVDAKHTVWQHLKTRDKWERPNGASDDQAFLMVQVMETWIVADRDLLVRYFGIAFRTQCIPAWPSLESVPKPDVIDALARATDGCATKRNAKGRVSFELLEQLDSRKVEEACPHAKAFLDYLRGL